jgi:hypothetical protein
MAELADKRIFNKEWDEQDQCWYLVVDTLISQAQRRILTRNVATVLQEPRALTCAKLKSSLFFEPELNTVYYFRLPEGRRHYPLAVWSKEWLDERGLLRLAEDIQGILLEAKYEPLLDAIFAEQDGKAYQYGVSFQPGDGPGRAQLTPSALKGEYIQEPELSTMILRLVSKVAEEGLPDLDSAARRHDNLKHTALIPGPKENHIFTGQQRNYAALETNLADQFGKFGDAHPDFHDDETSMTFLLNFSLLSEDHCGGRSIVPGLKVTIPLAPETCTCFSTRFLHFATSVPCLDTLTRKILPCVRLWASFLLLL